MSDSIKVVVSQTPTISIKLAVGIVQQPQNLFIGSINPNMASSGVWIQTGLPDDGMTIWVEDGVAL